jgi:hypothetical protein
VDTSIATHKNQQSDWFRQERCQPDVKPKRRQQCEGSRATRWFVQKSEQSVDDSGTPLTQKGRFMEDDDDDDDDGGDESMNGRKAHRFEIKSNYAFVAGVDVVMW